MRVSETCKVRQISIIDVSTPLIVPSFSSRGFTEFKEIYTSLKDYISDVSLLSAYDIYYEMQEMDIYASDIIFIDSGGYETQAIKLTATSDDVYANRDSSSIRTWSTELHQSVLDNLQSLSQLVLISYDNWDKHQLTLSQIETAKSLFQRYPYFASNFLYKPETPESAVINIDNLLKYSHHLTSFSVLGITEKELGNSILERCHNLIKIRSALQEQSIEIPIHILGCLDPVLMISYFLCGADIFDGLAWLRYAFVDGLTLYQSTAILMQEDWHYSESELNQLYSIKNLQNLRQLSHAMNKFCNTKLIQEFSAWEKVMPQVLNLIKNAGLEVEE
ncbi:MULTISPECIES: hypothetical protein [Nostoc]|uniref:tRNA-guanine(15) transglycosylase-like domain-containing protein n=1 Tax=Nostoc paludosum FACHB-159 TaxID=2692908 RepID=A0ABR8KIU8_9NOSO|nr:MULTISPECIES: hypothetical protein [Nostoc]MBD2682321.1 hypothetical protein [Nostoc sp. FACHB-857]MBD2738654.1 hypothetical protein [Nostoc paludosum FACHB-159]